MVVGLKEVRPSVMMRERLWKLHVTDGLTDVWRILRLKHPLNVNHLLWQRLQLMQLGRRRLVQRRKRHHGNMCAFSQQLIQ